MIGPLVQSMILLYVLLQLLRWGPWSQQWALWVQESDHYRGQYS